MNPFELTDYVAAVGALLVGLAVGRRMRPQPPEPLRPICSCGHGYGTHNSKGCASEKLTVYDEYNSKRLMKCPCLRYDGPDPAIFGLENA